VRFGVVLATPDDEGNAIGKSDERKHRARQNVVLELGLLLAKSVGRAWRFCSRTRQQWSGRLICKV
jgi:predicted nucleotide-binding protein